MEEDFKLANKNFGLTLIIAAVIVVALMFKFGVIGGQQAILSNYGTQASCEADLAQEKLDYTGGYFPDSCELMTQSDSDCRKNQCDGFSGWDDNVGSWVWYGEEYGGMEANNMCKFDCLHSPTCTTSCDLNSQERCCSTNAAVVTNAKSNCESQGKTCSLHYYSGSLVCLICGGSSTGCTESDGGDKPYVPGYVDINGNRYYDDCYDADADGYLEDIKEYSCNADGGMDLVTYICGEYWSGGYCIENPSGDRCSGTCTPIWANDCDEVANNCDITRDADGDGVVGEVPQTGNGQRGSNPSKCDDGTDCLDGACSQDCNIENAKQCNGQGGYDVCKSGKWVSYNCPSGQTCTNGVCSSTGLQQRGEDCGPLSGDCAAGLECTGTMQIGVPYVCWDPVLDKCQIQCAKQGNIIWGCTEAVCLSNNCMILKPNIYGVDPPNCVPCLPGAAKDGGNSANCCSKVSNAGICLVEGVYIDQTTVKDELVESITYSDLEGATTTKLAEHICGDDKDCDNDGVCKSFTYLKSNDYLTNSDTDQFYNTIGPALIGGAGGSIAGLTAGAAACYALSIATIEVPFVSASILPVCGLLITSGTVVGGVSGTVVGGVVGNKVSTVIEGIKNKDDSSVGVCIKEGGGGTAGKFCSYFDFIKEALPSSAKQHSCTIGLVLVFFVFLALIKSMQ